MTKREFLEGSMWEGGPWEIEYDHECSKNGGGRPCKHCHGERIVIHERSDKSTYPETLWTCPRVVVAYNEAGHNSTGVCLDCILEAEMLVHGEDASRAKE